jgi:predicted Zn finger-like uncharacterized protein
MYTRCPTCQTHFRVSREQLQASSGQVRCGRCQIVFDAFATLSAQPPTAARSKGPTKAAASPPTEPAAVDVAAKPSTPERRVEEESAARPPLVQTHDEVLTLPDDLFGSGVVAQETGRRWPWAAGSAVLLLLLVLQGLLFFGSELAASMPALRAGLTEGCEWLGCRIALARVPDQLFIEASDMQVLNPTRAGEVLLTATIRNRAAVAQELPLLEVTLTDALNQTAARKVFYPAQYLDKTQQQLAAVGPDQEILVKLYLDTSDIKPTGYRLYLFFA